VATALFRAGTVPEVSGPAAMPAAAGLRVLLADVSEFQADITDAAYLNWSKAIVIRGLYGTTVDAAWYGGSRRAALHAGGVRFLGIYQYLTAGEDPAVQAEALVRLLGEPHPGELPVCDLEVGAGSQAARWAAWRAVITKAWPGISPWLYSGLDFGQAAGLDPEWVAAYQPGEPGGGHKLWQFTDSYTVPGVGLCDCSVFHGSIDELAAYGWNSPAVTNPIQETDMGVQVTGIPLPAWAAGKTDGQEGVTVDLGRAGTYKEMWFSSDWSLGHGTQPELRVAVHSAAKGFTQVEQALKVPAAGRLVLKFAAADVDYVSVARASNSAAVVSAGA
jgi:hypothetical protein